MTIKKEFKDYPDGTMYRDCYGNMCVKVSVGDPPPAAIGSEIIYCYSMVVEQGKHHHDTFRCYRVHPMSAAEVVELVPSEP